MILMAAILRFIKGHPKKKGYYLARFDDLDAEGSKYGCVMYWNGEAWMTESDEDAFMRSGNRKPIAITGFDSYCEVKLNDM